MITISILFAASLAFAQTAPVKTSHVGFGRSPFNAVLYEPAAHGPKARIGIVYIHPNTNNAGSYMAQPLAARGYRILMMNHWGNPVGYEGMTPYIAEGVKYLRALPGIEKVVLLSASAGGPLMTFYQNLAENGPKVCQGPEKIYPCRGNLAQLPKGDALVLLDSHMGGGAQFLTYVDPAIGSAVEPTPRNASLDMFSAANAYNPVSKGAQYSEAFLKKFFPAQAARNAQIVEHARARLAKIEKGQGIYSDDEPLVIPGQSSTSGARAISVDVRLLSRTRAAHPLLKANGTMPSQVVHSIRPPQPAPSTVRAEDLGTFSRMATVTTVRRFLADSAIRTTGDYAFTADAITGIDWKSSATSLVSNIEGVTVPTLLMAASCHYWMVHNETAFNLSASKDKQYVLVEGATHSFNPCRPEFGDTFQRTFDYVDGWLNARFVAR